MSQQLLEPPEAGIDKEALSPRILGKSEVLLALQFQFIGHQNYKRIKFYFLRH